MGYKAYSKEAAREKAMKMRRMGYQCSLYKLKGTGKWGITAKRKR